MDCSSPPGGCRGLYVNRSSCDMFQSEKGIFDVVMANRTISSSLSIIGTLSIIFLVLGKRQVFNPKIHPIFVLSVADLLLAVVWTVGASFWARDIEDRKWCLLVSLLTVIIQCISINLALVYAIYAYITITKNVTDEEIPKDKKKGILQLSITAMIYIIACVLPILLVAISFGIVTGTSNILSQSEYCSCYCRPVFGNILPYALPKDKPTANFMYNIRKLIESYAIILSAHYFIVFVLMVVIYAKILKHIKKIGSAFDKTYDAPCGGSEARRENFKSGYSKAKIRVSLYLLIFIINGLSNFILTTVFAAWEAYQLPKKGLCVVPSQDRLHSTPHVLHFFMLICNSFLPLQGFLNAIVYGWTREDFISEVALKESYDMKSTSIPPSSMAAPCNATSELSTRERKQESSHLVTSTGDPLTDYETDSDY